MTEDVPFSLLDEIYSALDSVQEDPENYWEPILARFVRISRANGGSLEILEQEDGRLESGGVLAVVGDLGESPEGHSELAGRTVESVGMSGEPIFMQSSSGQGGGTDVDAASWLDERAVVGLHLACCEDFEQSEISGLVAHLARAVRTRRELQRLRAASDEADALVEASAVPAAVVDTSGRLIVSNERFDEILQTNALERRPNGAIAADSREATRSMVRRLRDIARSGPDESEARVDATASVVLDARPGDRTTVVGNPVRVSRCDEPCVLLSVYAPDMDHSIDEELLEQLYGLTPTESQTAARLAEGMSVKDIAQHRRCSTSTVRTHVKRILQKTDTHRQVDLVRRILSSPAATLTC